MAEVKVYTTTTCPYCHALKDYLKQKKIEFTEVNLDQQPEEVQTFVDTCGSMAVPCTHIKTDDGKSLKILGFDQAKINEALGLTSN